MKKLIIMTAILVGLSMPAQAHDFSVGSKGLSMTGFSFDTRNEIFDYGVLRIEVSNDTDSEIIAWSGSFECDNALGDKSITVGVKSENANIPAGMGRVSRFENLALMDDSWITISKAKAKNYNCELVNIKVAQ